MVENKRENKERYKNKQLQSKNKVYKNSKKRFNNTSNFKKNKFQDKTLKIYWMNIEDKIEKRH